MSLHVDFQNLCKQCLNIGVQVYLAYSLKWPFFDIFVFMHNNKSSVLISVSDCHSNFAIDVISVTADSKLRVFSRNECVFSSAFVFFQNSF